MDEIEKLKHQLRKYHILICHLIDAVNSEDVDAVAISVRALEMHARETQPIIEN